MNCIIIFIFISQICLSAAPLDRKSLYFIISFSLTLFAIWFLWLLKPMLLLLGDLVTLHKLHISESHGATKKGIKSPAHNTSIKQTGNNATSFFIHRSSPRCLCSSLSPKYLMIEELYKEHLKRKFPAGYGGEEVLGIDLALLDGDTAGWTQTFTIQKKNNNNLDTRRTAILGLCYRDLTVVGWN